MHYYIYADVCSCDDAIYCRYYYKTTSKIKKLLKHGDSKMKDDEERRMVNCYWELRKGLLKASKTTYKDDSPPDDLKLSKHFDSQLKELMDKGTINIKRGSRNYTITLRADKKAIAAAAEKSPTRKGSGSGGSGSATSVKDGGNDRHHDHRGGDRGDHADTMAQMLAKDDTVKYVVENDKGKFLGKVLDRLISSRDALPQALTDKIAQLHARFCPAPASLEESSDGSPMDAEQDNVVSSSGDGGGGGGVSGPAAAQPALIANGGEADVGASAAVAALVTAGPATDAATLSVAVAQDASTSASASGAITSHTPSAFHSVQPTSRDASAARAHAGAITDSSSAARTAPRIAASCAMLPGAAPSMGTPEAAVGAAAAAAAGQIHIRDASFADGSPAMVESDTRNVIGSSSTIFSESDNVHVAASGSNSVGVGLQHQQQQHRPQQHRRSAKQRIKLFPREHKQTLYFSPTFQAKGQFKINAPLSTTVADLLLKLRQLIEPHKKTSGPGSANCIHHVQKIRIYPGTTFKKSAAYEVGWGAESMTPEMKKLTVGDVHAFLGQPVDDDFDLDYSWPIEKVGAAAAAAATNSSRVAAGAAAAAHAAHVAAAAASASSSGYQSHQAYPHAYQHHQHHLHHIVRHQQQQQPHPPPPPSSSSAYCRLFK